MQQDFHGTVYQINTRVWLQELSGERGRPVTLGDIPDAALDHLAQLNFHWLWLLGIWTTGAEGRKVSATNPNWRQGYAETLGEDLRQEDICGSPFAVKEYVVHPDFGGDAELALLRARLRERGIHLLLDFVPNHTALDHPWVHDRPEFYIHGTEEDLASEPHNYRLIETPDAARILAHGRDPHSHGWPDTFQLNYGHPALQEAMRAELLRIADRCDGVRCDMAMLILPEIIGRTWGQRSCPHDGTDPAASSFWPDAIALVREKYPNFLFVAEVYWDLEYTLQQQGFDYTYDKRLYDRLFSHNAESIKAHLVADIGYQRRLLRFIENHDEPRVAGALSPEVHRAAAVTAFLTPGIRLFNDGQLHGRKTRLSIHLSRRPAEPLDRDLWEFYADLLQCLARPEVRYGRWQLLECHPAWEENRSCGQFISSVWSGDDGKWIFVLVNYANSQGHCYVPLPFSEMQGKRYILRDLLSSTSYERDGDVLTKQGLYLDMPAWGYHVFEVLEADASPEPHGLKS
jgi:glycosidase